MAKANPGIGRLLAAMRKMVTEVNDQEICRRLEILQNSEKEDLAPSLIKRLLEAPEDFDAREVTEPYTQYVKHYLYMVKRDSREKARVRARGEEGESSKSSTKSRSGVAGRPTSTRTGTKVVREKTSTDTPKPSRKPTT